MASKIKIERIQGGYRLELTDAQAKMIYDHMVVKKMVGNLAVGTDILDEVGVLLAQAMEKEKKPPKKGRSSR